MRHPLSIEALVDWLETKSGPYEYVNAADCLAAQYFKSIGMQYQLGISFPETIDELRAEPFISQIEEIAQGLGKMWKNHNQTFEGALERARMLL